MIAMQFDILSPEGDCSLVEASCVIAAVFFSEEELIEVGTPADSMSLDTTFVDFNEFEKAFALWGSPLFLSDFYDSNKTFFEQDYWHGLTEEQFLRNVSNSIDKNQFELIETFENGTFASLVAPLDKSDEDKRDFDSIRVKIKQGTIGTHYPFRFYAIEVEENKCYIITGGTIKVHKDMRKAPNTILELNKLDLVLKELISNNIDTKESFINYLNQ